MFAPSRVDASSGQGPDAGGEMHEIEVRNRGHREGLIRWSLQGLLPLALCLLGGSAVAQPPPPRFLSEPRPLHLLGKPSRSVTAGQKGKAKLQGGERVGREIRHNLGIKYVTGEIDNPSTGGKDKVRLRSYVDLNEKMEEIPNPDHKFIAPLIYMKPGQTVRITLSNQLEAEGKGGVKCGNDQNNPNCFNSTNLHSHGLWVSPVGNSDNVLLDIKPKTNFQYEYNVPVDHPAGTYWYHPHVHGSTAVQVGSGMAGALIIQGDQKPEINEDGTLVPGDIDTLLEGFAPKELPTAKALSKAPGQEDQKKHDYVEVLLFQQIPYACFDQDGKIQTEKDAAGKAGRWTCGENEVGQVEDFDNQFGRGKWAASGRYTSINGSVHAPIQMEAGRVYRWRLIDAGVHESISLRITQVASSVILPEKLTPEQEKDYVDNHCAKGQVVSQFEVAADGLTRGQIVKRDTNVLQPGYRSDVLFAFPSEGTYCLYDAPAPQSSSVGNATEGPKLLGQVTVKGGKSFSEKQETFIKRQLKNAAQERFTGTVQAKVIADLDDGLKTTAFVQHKSFSDEDLTELDKKKTEEVKFSINKVGDATQFQINGKSFEANGKPKRTLLLGTAQKWILTTEGPTTGNHPFHIHVNPFQVLQILGPDGKEINYEKDPDYLGMKGAWKDTILVKQDYKVIMATRYERYIGDFVLHCHILDHEDKGMMETIRIAPHDGAGNPVSFSLDGHGAHHHGPAAQTASSGSEVH
jgi:L-ascorbate oxidase